MSKKGIFSTKDNKSALKLHLESGTERSHESAEANQFQRHRKRCWNYGRGKGRGQTKILKTRLCCKTCLVIVKEITAATNNFTAKASVKSAELER